MTCGSARRARDLGCQHTLARSGTLDSVGAAGERHSFAEPARLWFQEADRIAVLGRRWNASFLAAEQSLNISSPTVRLAGQNFRDTASALTIQIHQSTLV
jgi:hypothetical protein